MTAITRDHCVDFMNEAKRRLSRHETSCSDTWWTDLEQWLDAQNDDAHAHNDDSLGALLLDCCAHYPGYPIQAYQAILKQRNGRPALYIDEETLYTPLHMSVSRQNRLDVVLALLKVAPQMVHQRDAENQMRPIDTLVYKILITEEKVRYNTKKNQTQGMMQLDQIELIAHWETAKALVLAHGIGDLQRNIPILHAALLQTTDIPLSLIERAIRRYGVEERDDYGNLPLHIAASLPHNQESDLLEEILFKNNEKARIRNYNGETALDLAIRSGRTWSTGCEALLRKAPETFPRFDSSHLGVLVHQIFQTRETEGEMVVCCYKPTIVFALLRENAYYYLMR